jgi:iron-sulfur cluster assembly accessory protein
MPEIVDQRDGFGQILVGLQGAGDRAGDLRDLYRMGKARAVVVALMRHEDLGLVLEATEGGRVDDAVAVALERRARRTFGFRNKAPARGGRITGIGSARPVAEADPVQSRPAILHAATVDLAPAASYLWVVPDDKAQVEGTDMGSDAKQAMKGVDLTDAAAARILTIVANEPGKSALRVSVEGGGCSGFSYRFDLADDRNEDDVAIEKSGATVLIDEISLVYMGGSVIDFVDDLMGQSFQIRNPNAVASCGCGTSFSV